jgi:hypothetical protein
MKRIVLGILVMVSINAAERQEVVSESDQMPQVIPLKKGLDAKTKKILAQFANIVINFFSIVQNPKNTAHVTEKINEMVNNAVNIVTESIKAGELSLDATAAELQEFAEKVRKQLIVE